MHFVLWTFLSYIFIAQTTIDLVLCWSKGNGILSGNEVKIFSDAKLRRISQACGWSRCWPHCRHTFAFLCWHFELFLTFNRFFFFVVCMIYFPSHLWLRLFGSSLPRFDLYAWLTPHIHWTPKESCECFESKRLPFDFRGSSYFWK